MWMACRNLYADNHAQLDHIDDLQMIYDKKEAILYYTGNSCLSRIINQACHTENIQQIFTFRNYISDLHRRLDELNIQRQKENNNGYNYDLYRGKVLSESILQQLIDNKGGLISMNGFLSTTFDRNVVLMFAGAEKMDQKNRSVIFQFRINKRIKQPFANISNCSNKPYEAEVLFSLGTIWHLESVEHNINPCIIKLTSCNELDSQLTKLIEKYTKDGYNLLSLADILYELGDYISAEWFYRKMLQQDHPDNETRIKLYHKIGTIRFERDDYPVALENFEKSERLMKEFISQSTKKESFQPIYKYYTQSSLIAIHSNIGFLHALNNRFDHAIKCYTQALDQKGSSFERAMAYNNLGLIHFADKQYKLAFEHHTKAVRLVGDRYPWKFKFETNLHRVETRLSRQPKTENK